VPKSKYYDLAALDSANRLLRDYPPDIVIHLAASCPDISGTGVKTSDEFDPMDHPDVVMWRNILIAAKHNNTEQMMTVWDYHAYPTWCKPPFWEQEAADISKWEGYDNYRSPSEVFLQEVVNHGESDNRDYKITSFITGELYGPGDRFYVNGRRLMSSTIRTISDAKENDEKSVDVLGHPDDNIDIMYVGDAADGIVNVIEKGGEGGIVNIGSGCGAVWGEVVEQIAKYLNYSGEIRWIDGNRNPNQISLNTALAKGKYGFQAETEIQSELLETVQWFCAHRRFILENEAEWAVPNAPYPTKRTTSKSRMNINP
jgi:GDP-L-fucose synthase